MFEREIKFIYDFNLNKVTKLGPYFTFEQLLSTDLHPAILHYISAEIDFLIFEDRQRLLKNSIFDYSGEKITHHFALISEEVKRSKRLSQEYISKLILHATSFTINFLVRPNWTLLKFIYDEGDHKTTTEIKQILNYLYYYKFLKKVIIKYINTKKILSMNSKEFSELLLKVDKLGLESNLGGVLSNSLKSMAEFFNIGELLKSKIPFLAVEMYLEEKQLKGHLEKLRDVFDEDKTNKYNISEYQKIFGGLIFQKEEVVIDQPIEEEIEPETQTQESIDSYEEINELEATTDKDKNEFAEVETPNPIEILPDHELESKNNIEIEGTDDSETIIENQYNVDRETEQEEVQEKIGASELKPADEDETDSGSGLFDNVFNNQQDEIEIDSDKLDEDQEVLESQSESGDESEIFQEHKEKKSPFKFKFKFGKNNKIEKIQDEESEQPEINGEELKKQIAEKIGSEEENAFEKPYEDVLNIENQLNEINEDVELDSSDDELNNLLDKADDYSDVLDNESENVKEEAKDEEENVDESMILDEDENESMLKSILSESKDTDDQDEYDSSLSNQTTDEKQSASKVELAELLERKEMTKIIEILFDYDIEEFSNTLEQIVVCDNLDDANKILNSTLKKNKVSRRSKEAETFRQIISEFFNRD